MDLYPAIDLRDGRCVRLVQGDFDREVAYGADPITVAQDFAAAGAPWIHVVDLDAARSGSAANLDLIGAIAGSVAVPIQAGGGVRSLDAAAALHDAGVARVVVGTAAVEHPELVAELAARGQRVAVGLDVRGDEVAVRGWEQGSGLDLFTLLDRFAGAGADAVVITQIARDGMLGGADIDGLAAALGHTGIPVIASGGVGTLADIEELARLEVGGRRLHGAIVGKALHDGRFTIAEAVHAASGVRGRG